MPKKGKKSVRWDRDPEILARLESVNQMMLRGAQRWQIADALDISLRTASRDINRVRILRRRAAERDVEEKVNDSVGQFQAVRQEAWLRYDEIKKANPTAAARWLKLITEATKEIGELWGLRKLSIELSGPDGGPVEHKGVGLPNLDALSDEEFEEFKKLYDKATKQDAET
jgi:hypothetical protein